MSTDTKSPVLNGVHQHTAAGALSNRDWWPNQLNLQILHQNSPLSNPMGEEFNYAEEFKKLDLDALKIPARNEPAGWAIRPSEEGSVLHPPGTGIPDSQLCGGALSSGFEGGSCVLALSRRSA